MEASAGWVRAVLLAGLVLLLVGLGALGWMYRRYIVQEPGDHISREYILQRISQESPVYYRDGVTKIGVFFGDEHRQYVKFDELPKDYINAIVAAEDKRFWQHPGFDVLGFTRAMLGNLKARRLVAGGSTITSQTAKNLYDRKGRSLGPKLEEVVNAFRLEAHYSKEEILEFYVNQFHVYGNGRGLGVAARYFFDKDVSELTTLECAFLAGVVKGPYQYNPFVGTTEEARERARRRAENRVDYVLKRMAEEGYLEPSAAEALKAEDIPFRQGTFRFEQNVILDHIYDTLQEEPFASILAEHGIIDPASAGIEIVTTVDPDWQAAAEYGLRHNLTEVGVILEDKGLAAFVAEATESLPPIRPEHVRAHRFFEGRVLGAVTEGKGAPSLQVDIGGVTTVADREALGRVATLLKQAADGNRWAKPSSADVAALASQFKPGQAVWVSVRQEAEGEAPARVDLESRTELQGAVVALERGEIRAMVGGSDNRNFNRAVNARRQLGSTWKPLVYAAALSLGWKSLDPVDNRKQGFPFQTQPFYWPRADHDPPADFMSMAYSGTSSENLAAVSLFFHLTDPLTEDQRLDLARRVDLAPTPDEEPKAYGNRIRDDWGILPDDDSLKEGLFDLARAQVWPDLAFEGLLQQDIDAVRQLPYGRGFVEERERLPKAKLGAEERAERERFLRRNFLGLETEAVRARSELRQLLDGSGEATTGHFYRWDREGEPWLVYSEHGAQPGWVALESAALVRQMLRPGGPPTQPDPAEAPAEAPSGEPPADAAPADPDSAYDDPNQGGQGSANRRLLRRGALREALAAVADAVAGAPAALLDPMEIADKRLLIEGVTPPVVLDRLREALDGQFATRADLDRYDVRRLIYDRDFRVLMGMLYTVNLAREAGVESPLKPVLSLPLGSNDTTLLEAALVYQTFLEGRIHTFGGTTSEAAILREIRGADGTVLWRSSPGWKQVLEPRIAAQVGRILRGVVERGTGREAEAAVVVTSPDPVRQREIAPFNAALPVWGKTGTTNSYVNTAFVGFVPTLPGGVQVGEPGGPEEPLQRLPYGSAFTLAAYVGYDDNRPMKRSGIRIAGASGALPVWIDTAKGVVRALDLSRSLDLVDLAFSGGGVLPIEWPAGMTTVAVDKKTGLPVEAPADVSEGGVSETSDTWDIFEDATTTQEVSRYEPFLGGRGP